jgi:Mg/Co/Ni transporter MgtE
MPEATDVLDTLDEAVRALLRHDGTEDHGEVCWISLSDDAGATRLIVRAPRQKAAALFGQLSTDQVLRLLADARAAKNHKVVLDFEDGSVS